MENLPKATGMAMKRPVATAVAMVCILVAVFFLLWGIQLGMLFAPTAGKQESYYLARADRYVVLAIAFLVLGILSAVFVKR
jgi:hypothetical protein